MSEIATVWNPSPAVEGEYAQSDGSDICTESSSDLLTETSVAITIEDSTFTQIPGTVWSLDAGA